MEPDTRDAVETPDSERSELTDALEWFHQQLDCDLPDECDHDTARDYYRDGRGWDGDTIGKKLLGFAPANYKDALIAHLFDRGHGREEILATGLFGERDDENLYATWNGLYVLNLVRTTEYVKPYHSSDHVNTEQDAILFEAVTEKHAEWPSVITSSTAEHEYEADGVLEHVDETKHYGNVLSSNEFDDTRLGAVIGSIHYGDGYFHKPSLGYFRRVVPDVAVGDR